MRIKGLLLIFSFVLTSSISLSAQEFVEQITNFFEFSVGNHHPEDSTKYVSKVVLAPIVTYEPATSWGFGVGAKFLFKPFGAGLDTRTSNIPISAEYTLNNQIVLASNYTVFFPKESFLLKGNIAFIKFPFGYYGVGNLSKESDRIEIAYDNFLLEPLLLKRVVPNLFVGGGWRYNTYRDTRLYESHLDLPEGYNLQDSLGSTSSGFELAITLDSRNNVLNAAHGVFAEFTHGFYDEWMGSTHKFMLSKLNYRQYWQVSPKRPYDAVAIEVYSRFSWGDTPNLELSTLGGSEFLRGFQEGRFRDRFAFFTQAEYRWQALDRIGMVFFGGMGEVTNDFSKLNIRDFKYSLGSGIRLKIVKSENLNIRFDYAFGFGPSPDHNFYLGIAEAF